MLDEVHQSNPVNALEDRCSPSFSFMGVVGKKLVIKTWMREIFCCAWSHTEPFDGDAFSLLFQRPFTFWHTCFCIAAVVVLQMFCKICVCMFVGLWVPMCFGMANDWGFFFFFFSVVSFANWSKKNWKFFFNLKNFYIWLILIKKLNLFCQTFDITKSKPKKKTLAKDSHHN
jgi:hypothetical protein